MIVASAGALAAAEGPADEKGVLDALDRYKKGAMTKDRKALDEVFDDTLMYSHSNTKLENKAEAIAALMSPTAKYDITFKKQTVHVYGNFAVTRGDALFITGAERTVNDLNILMAWVKSSKGWRMVARQATRHPK